MLLSRIIPQENPAAHHRGRVALNQNTQQVRIEILYACIERLYLRAGSYGYALDTCEPFCLKGRVAAELPTVAAMQSARRMQMETFMARFGILQTRSCEVRSHLLERGSQIAGSAYACLKWADLYLINPCKEDDSARWE